MKDIFDADNKLCIRFTKAGFMRLVQAGINEVYSAHQTVPNVTHIQEIDFSSPYQFEIELTKKKPMGVIQKRAREKAKKVAAKKKVARK